MSVGPRSSGAMGPSTVCTSPCRAGRLAGVIAPHRTPRPCGPSMLRTGCARERPPIVSRLAPPRALLRTRLILDEDVNATAAVNDQGTLIRQNARTGTRSWRRTSTPR